MNSSNVAPISQGQKLDTILDLLQKGNIAQKEVLTIDEVGAYTGLSKSYLYKLTSTNQIPFYKPNNKMVYFKRQEIEEWLLQNRRKTKAEIEGEAATYLVTNKKG